MSDHIRRDHEELLESLIHGKLPRNLSWSAVVDLIAQIGEVQPHGHDEFLFVIGSKRELFKRPSSHDLSVEEISRLRHFLHEAGALPDGIIEKPAKANQPGRMVVVIDHHAAHVYHDRGVNLPEDEVAVKPYDPHGFHHHLIHRKEAHYVGERVPEEDSWYEQIAQDLAHAQEIILIGHATGTSNAAVFLSAYLKSHHPETFLRIIATETADLSAITEPEIEVIAKKAFSRQV
ncbi:MAG: hypothetical protein ABR957_03345 [Terracidiphilus sp.]|jgi:hypothetical protein